ncbi:MAG: sulfatase-like hydrolase/transferase [Clostridia bacterium]|nr:sulfatase-like hydrolase/transferase [Clostridia bacterium]
MKKKHVLMLFCDQQRFDTIHALGNEDIVTPALDKLANEAVVFDRAYTPSPVCVPARMSMFAGQYCNRTGNNTNNKTAEYKGEGFYSEFTKAGYNTCCIGKMHHNVDLYGSMGFRKRLTQEEMANPTHDDYTKFIKNSPYKNVFDYNGQRTELYYVPQVSQLPMEAHPTQWIGDRAVEFINGCKPDEEPVFLVASFIHPHPPFCPPSPWNKMYRGVINKTFVPEDPDSYEDMMRNRYTLDAFGISPRRLETLTNHYYACISFVDYQISRIVEALKQKGMYDDTIILFSSDHGEMLGDYRTMGKRSMVDSAAKIPFLLKLPGQEHAIRHDPASLVDVAPTLLAAAGIAYDKKEYDGVDLMTEQHEEVYSQYGNGNLGLYMVTSGHDKLVYSAIGDHWFYFDRLPDAVNKFDLSNPRVAELKAKLDAYMASDCCKEIDTRPASNPYKQEKYSFYPQLDDHFATFEEEYARMPEGYKITLGGKHTDY